MTATIFYQGVELMLYGMGTVIAFLVLLIGITRLMSWIVFRFPPESKTSNGTSIEVAKIDRKVVAAIGVGLSHFRNKKNNHSSKGA